MAEAIILGSGTSNGIPSLGAIYPQGYLDNPKNRRTRASLMLRGPSGNVLVDCTPEMRLQVTGQGITELEAVIITHTHADHIMGMDDLRSICMRTGNAVIVYTMKEHADDIKRVFAYAFQDFPPGILVPRFDMREMPEVLNTAGLEIRSFTVAHGATSVIGLRVNDFAYITDVSEIPDAAMEKLQGLDVLVLDAVRYRPHPNHFHLEKAIEVAKAIDARMTYFTHLSDDFDHDPVAESLPDRFDLAYDGLKIAI